MIAISLDKDFDLQVKHGSLLLGDTQEQNAALIVNTEKGEWKEHPLMGAGLSRMVKTSNSQREIIRHITVALEADGITAAVTINDGKLQIDL